jgi:hypothetical protein
MTEQNAPLHFGLQYRDGSHEGPEAPKHCRSCGRPMRLYSTLGFRQHAKFNSDGTPNVIRHAECSRPWFDVRGFHDHAIADEFGDWPWVG